MNYEDIGKSVVKETKYILTGDIGSKAVYLGFDENRILDIAAKHEIYGEDGSGYSEIRRDYSYPEEDFQKVITAILDEADSDMLMVIDDN